MLRLVAGLLTQSAVFTALILGPTWIMTGGVNWPRGWLALAVLVGCTLVGGLWFAKTDPDLTRERAYLPRPQTRGDALASGAVLIAVLVWFTAAAADAHRLHLFDLSALVALPAGLCLFFSAVAVIVWTLRVNSFAATVVKVQDERSQSVIDSGPYGWVRHPMYSGAIGFFTGLGLILGSAAAAALALPLFALAFLPRMLVEENVLRRDLLGYAEYQSKVRFRLIPGLL